MIWRPVDSAAVLLLGNSISKWTTFTPDDAAEKILALRYRCTFKLCAVYNTEKNTASAHLCHGMLHRGTFPV